MTEEKIQQADVHLAAPGSLSALRAATVGQPLWIPVAERLPEPGTDCLVWHREYAPGFGRYAKVDRWDEQHESPVGWSSATIPVGPGWSDSDFDDVTHWMPLPGAPTGQSQTFEAGEATCASNEPDEKDPTPVADKGPWEVNEWDARIVLQSHDFTHDAALIVSGDFASRAQKLQYANNLAAQLNDQQRAKGYTASLLPLPQPTGERE